jgi:hypothetical protein
MKEIGELRDKDGAIEKHEWACELHEHGRSSEAVPEGLNTAD